MDTKKLTTKEIQIAGQAAHDAYYSDGYEAGRKIADQLQSQMILRGNTSDDDKDTFKNATSYSWNE